METIAKALLPVHMLILGVFLFWGEISADDDRGDVSGLDLERERAIKFISGKSAVEPLEFCAPFVSYGRYFLDKKQQGASFVDVELRLRYLLSSVQRHVDNSSPSEGLITLMLEYGRNIYESDIVSPSNIDISSILYCKSVKESLKSILMDETYDE